MANLPRRKRKYDALALLHLICLSSAGLLPQHQLRSHAQRLGIKVIPVNEILLVLPSEVDAPPAANADTVDSLVAISDQDPASSTSVSDKRRRLHGEIVALIKNSSQVELHGHIRTLTSEKAELQSENLALKEQVASLEQRLLEGHFGQFYKRSKRQGQTLVSAW